MLQRKQLLCTQLSVLPGGGGDEGVDQEFVVVRFDDFGESSLNILLYYFTKATDYDPHLETKERVNLKVMRALEGLGLSIAFPTRTVYFEGDIGKGIAGLATRPPDEKKEV